MICEVGSEFDCGVDERHRARGRTCFLLNASRVVRKTQIHESFVRPSALPHALQPARRRQPDPELVEQGQNAGMNALAITDHGNLYGAIEFYDECRRPGINPIIGYEAYIAPASNGSHDRSDVARSEAGFHLTLLAQNRTGFKNLVKMASVAFLEGYYYVPRIDKELLEPHSEGLICLSRLRRRRVQRVHPERPLDEATQTRGVVRQLFGDDFYVEIQNNGLDIQKRCAPGADRHRQRSACRSWPRATPTTLPTTPTPTTCCFCVNTGKTLERPKRMQYGSDQFYVRPPEEMYTAFPGPCGRGSAQPGDRRRGRHRARLQEAALPVFAPPDGKTDREYLPRAVRTGPRTPISRRRNSPATAPAAAKTRLDHELGIINRMGFASYFLIVWDFVRFARENGIPASARGSACGAIVSYVLDLSHVCPLEYDLLFERFLDPNRSEAPDIDIDFCQDRRDEVIEYVREKYGEANVAQIGTFGTLAAKAAIKDVGRALNIPLARVDADHEAWCPTRAEHHARRGAQGRAAT